MLNVDVERIRKTKFYRLFFSYDENLKEKIKALPFDNRKWDNNVKAWELDVLTLMDLIKSYKGSTEIFFNFGGNEKRLEYLSAYKELDDKRKRKESFLEEIEKKNILSRDFKDHLESIAESIDLSEFLKPEIVLYPHQKVGVKFLEFAELGFLGLEMGLGKTICAILACDIDPSVKRVLVITPNSLKVNFCNEVFKFTNSKAHILNYNSNKYSLEESKFIIINYEYFNSSKFNKKIKIDKYGIDNPDVIICDESHRMKETSTNTYKNIFKCYGLTVKRKFLLSGTPAPSRAEELYGQFHFLSPIQFETKQKFLEYYCGMKYDVMYGWVQSGEPKYEELFQKLNCYMYRKRKKDVLKDMPPKTHVAIEIEMSNQERKEYEKIENQSLQEIDEFDGSINEVQSLAITVMLKLRMFLSDVKIKYCKSFIDRLLEEGEKIVVVDFFKKSLNQLHEIYKDVSDLHTGDQKDFYRADVVRRFQEEDLKIFLGSEGTTKEGLTLTKACYMFIISEPYVPGVLDQIGDRINRIGQTRPCTIYLPIILDTIDKIIWEKVEEKKKNISRFVDNETYDDSYQKSIAYDVLKQLLERRKLKK
jgi:SNF2 family DNA or RNA helicase